MVSSLTIDIAVSFKSDDCVNFRLILHDVFLLFSNVRRSLIF